MSHHNIKRIPARELTLRYGKPWRTLLAFSIPTILMLTITSLYTLMNKLFAVKFGIASETAWVWNNYHMHLNSKQMADLINSGTQYATQSYTLLTSFAVIVALGAIMKFTMNFGRRDFVQTRLVAGNGFSAAIIMSIVGAVIVILLTEPNLGAVFVASQIGSSHTGVERDIVIQLSWKYTVPFVAGAPLFFTSLYWTRIIACEGRRYEVMAIVVIGFVVSLLFGWIFTGPVGLGTYGPMLGTLVSWGVQLALALYIALFTKDSCSNFSWRDFAYLKFKNFINFFETGFPNFVMYIAFMLIGYVATLLSGSLNTGDTKDLQLVIGVFLPWSVIVLSIGLGLNQGTRSIIAYNYGARKFERIWDIFKRSAILMVAWFVIVLIVFIAAANPIMEAFSFPADKVADYRWEFVLCFMCYPFVSFSYMMLGLFQGVNRSMLSLVVSALRSIVFSIGMTVIGWAVANAVHNPIWFFVFIGLIDFFSSAVLVPLVWRFWKRHNHKITNHPDSDEVHLAHLYSIITDIRTVTAHHITEFNHFYQNHKRNLLEKEQQETVAQANVEKTEDLSQTNNKHK